VLRTCLLSAVEATVTRLAALRGSLEHDSEAGSITTATGATRGARAADGQQSPSEKIGRDAGES
jgi:hypothetical protein